jgi:hypothetical protein
MEDFLHTQVWPGVSRSRAMILRFVLHNPPFRIRTVLDLTTAPLDADTLATALEIELTRRSQAGLSDSERTMLFQFVTSGSVDTTGVVAQVNSGLSSQLSEEQARPRRKVKN